MKRKSTKLKWLMAAPLGCLLLTTAATATPYASTKCNGLKAKIQHPEGAQGVLFDEDCQTAYVLPPEEGRSRMTALEATSNINYCRTVNKLPTLTEKMVTSLEIVGDKVLAMIKDFEPQNQELQELRENTDNLNADYEMVKSQFEALEVEESELKQNYINAKQDYNDCLELNDSEPELCNDKKSNVEIAKTEWRGLKLGEYRTIQRTMQAKKNALDKSRRALARQTEDLTASLDPLYSLQEKVFGLKDQISTLYNEYGPMRAVTGQIVFSVEWSKILNDYQRINRDAGVNFVKVPIIDAKIHATAYVDGGKKQVGIPTLLHAAIPGLGKLGTEAIGEGDTEIKPDESVPVEVQSVALGIGDAAVSGQMTLSAVGACPYFPEGDQTKRDEITGDEMTGYMTVNAVYEFPLKARRKYKAEYRLSRMMERFERKKKKNGFFSSKTIHEVVENSNSSDWFKIKFDANDPDFSYTKEEQDAITKEVKMGLVQRSLGHVAATTFATGGNPPPLPGMLPTGASVVGNSLIKTCGFWIYCRVGGFVLKALNSIFGSSEAISKFKRTNRNWVVDEVDQVAVMRRTTSLTFTAK